MQIPDKLRNSANADKYFSFGQRNHVGAMDKAISQRAESREAWDMWETWVFQAIEAVRRLHELGYVHGAITPSVLRIDDSLKLGGLNRVRPRGSTPPLDVFEANALGIPPELLLYWGTKEGRTFSCMMEDLRLKNWPMNEIQRFFENHMYTDSVFHAIQINVNDNIAELGEAIDVWMLGYSLLSVYTSMLGNPFAINSEFYTKHHEEFLDLIEGMVHPDPTKRPKLSELKWPENSTTLDTSTSVLSADETHVPVVPSATAATAATAPVRYRRLALNVPFGSEERNKTRRSRRS